MSFFSGEPPREKTNKPPLSFSSLPNDLVLDILDRVPRRYHTILSYVSKNLQDHIRSPELQEKRFLLRRDSLYICFNDKSKHDETRKWYNLRRIKSDPIEDILVTIEVPSPTILNYSSIIAIDHEIFFVCGTNVPSSNLLIYDSRSRKFRRGPDMIVKRFHNSLGLVGEKIYVIGGYTGSDMFQAESFDLKKQIWEVAPIPDANSNRWICIANVTLGRKVYSLCWVDGMTGYDTRDGSCESFLLPKDKWWRCGVCVMQNVLYVYFARCGLMWFDTTAKMWKSVDGLGDLEKVRSIGMAEYYGKMAFLWKRNVNEETKEIWCRMIGLVRSEVGIQGTAGPAQLLETVPRSYRLQHCLSVSV